MAPSGIGGRVEGVHAVSAALAAGRVRRLTVAAARREAPELMPLLAAAATGGVPVAVVPDAELPATTDAPQGVVADAEPIPFAGLEAVAAAASPPAVVVLDHVEDPRNVGAIARSAVAAGVPGLVMPTRRAAPLEATAFKAAAGAFEHMTVAGVSSIADAVQRLQRLGLWAVGLSAAAERSLIGLDLLAEPVAIVLGAEGRGLSRLVAERVDVTAAIPLRGPVESLNVSVAAALAVFETARLRGGPA